MKMHAWAFALVLMAGSVAAADDLENAFTALQTAETKNDLAQIKQLALAAYTVANQESCAPAPEDASDKDAWKNRVDYAKSIQVHAEYALYVAAMKAPAATGLDLMQTLEKMNPSSKYLDQGYGLYFKLLTQTGATAKIPAVAERGLARFPNNSDLLMLQADAALSHRQPDKALSYARRLVTAANAKKPVDTAALSRGYWIEGIIEGQKNEYAQCDKDLRAALPYIKTNDAMLGPALFYLGVSNYFLGREMMSRGQMQEALRFSKQSAGLKHAYTDQAFLNAKNIEAELAKR